MNLPVKATILDLTPTAVAREMGFPISTIFRWMKKDCIPGKGPAHEWRCEQFEAAVKRLRERKETEDRGAAEQQPEAA